MPKAAGALKAIRGKSAREIGARSLQHLMMLRERFSTRQCSEMEDSELLEQLYSVRCDSGSDGTASRDPVERAGTEVLRRLREHPILPSLLQLDQIAEAMALLFPDESRAIIDKADQAIQGRFDIFGNPEIQFGKPVNWSLEPVTGKQAPLIHWSAIDYLNPEIAGEKKNTWELNRHSHFVIFGQAFVLTSDERYVRALMDQMESWMDANPPNLGINWSSSLELAFRSIAWIWALSLTTSSTSLTGRFVARVVKHLIAHGRHIESYLSTYFSPNTHLTGEALGLLYLGAALPGYVRANEWKRKAVQILMEQLRLQIRDDGVYFEQSSYYHRYTVDFYLHLLLLARNEWLDLETELRPALEKMGDYLMWIIRPESTPTLIGDDDGGKLLALSTRSNYDFRDSLAVASAVLGCKYWKFVAGEDVPELLWLLGPAGLNNYFRLDAAEPCSTVREFASAGQYVARSGWDTDSAYLFFRCGPVGALSGAHDHADQLSIELAANGTCWLVDPGTFTYTLDALLRNRFRLTSAHNTLEVDRVSQSTPRNAFSWTNRASGAAEKVLANEWLTCFEGQQNGYQSLPWPVTHRRVVAMLRSPAAGVLDGNAAILVADFIGSAGKHTYSLNYHFGPGIEVAEARDGLLAKDKRDGALSMRFVSSMEIEASVSTTDVSTQFGLREPAALGRTEGSGEGDQWIATVMAPASAGSQSPLISLHSAEDQGASIHWDNANDLIRIGEGVLYAGDRVIWTNALVTIARQEGDILSVAMVHGDQMRVESMFKLSLVESGTVFCELRSGKLSIQSSDRHAEIKINIESSVLRVFGESIIDFRPGATIARSNGCWAERERN